eukprot:gene16435-biopygen5261
MAGRDVSAVAVPPSGAKGGVHKQGCVAREGTVARSCRLELVGRCPAAMAVLPSGKNRGGGGTQCVALSCRCKKVETVGAVLPLCESTGHCPAMVRMEAVGSILPWGVGCQDRWRCPAINPWEISCSVLYSHTWQGTMHQRGVGQATPSFRSSVWRCPAAFFGGGT